MWFLGLAGGFVLWLAVERFFPSKSRVLSTLMFCLCMMVGFAVIAWADSQTLSLMFTKLRYFGPAYR